MRLSSIMAFLVLFGVLHAYQTLDAGYFFYYNVSVVNGSSIFVGLGTNTSVSLVVIKSSEFAAWQHYSNVAEIYNSSVGSGIYKVSVAPGRYTVLVSATTTARLSGGVVAAPDKEAVVVSFKGSHAYNLTLDNNSIVNVTILTDSNFQAVPMRLKLLYYNTLINSDSNLEFLNFTLSRGSYQIVLESAAQTKVLVLIGAEPRLVDPLEGLSGPLPVGVASYGIYNRSGTLVPYQISTSGVVGTANITQISATSLNTSDNNSPGGASLQLNAMLNTEYENQKRIFWLQDVVDFNTNQGNRTLYFVSNIWNNTLPSAGLSGSVLSGSGNISSCYSCSSKSFYAYSYPYGRLGYALPFNVKLVILENQTVNGTLVSFGYQVLQNGTGGIQPLVFFDRVLLFGSYNSSLLVTPYYTTPPGANNSGNFYDAELVFGGESGGAESVFSKLSAVLWIYYYNSSGELTPFPSSWTFGLDTKESAGNLKVLPYGAGEGAFVTTGVFDQKEQIVVGKAINTYAAFVSNTSKYTAPIVNRSGGYNGSASGQSSSAQLPINIALLLSSIRPYALDLVALAVVLAVFAALRRR
ncbi:MAG: thermopsin family protease [Candidatus Micrarchaeaceae archaeon]